nr:SMI1/KNR4 family protein [Streptomyces sp. SID8381]
MHEHAPSSAEALRPGASDEEIAALKRSVECDIPPALEMWLRVNNGSTAKDVRRPIPGGGISLHPHPDSLIFPGGMKFLGCKEIIVHYVDYLRIAQDIGDTEYWKPSWIPIAAQNDAPYGIILDTQSGYNPPPLLRFSEGDYPSFYLPSLCAFLQPLAGLLETGEEPGSAVEFDRYFVADGRIHWPY